VTILETDRLRLREFTAGDAAFVLRLLNGPSFLENIGDKGVRTVEDAVKYLVDGPIRSYTLYGHGLYLVERKDSGEPAGMCGLLKRDEFEHPDIGYAFLPEHTGRGLAIEAARAVLDDARGRLGYRKIIAIVRPGNARSIRLLEKLGLSYAGRASMPPDGHEVLVYEIAHGPTPDDPGVDETKPAGPADRGSDLTLPLAPGEAPKPVPPDRFMPPK
jgi:ribosomal-protein-alanine N-acetyltransferase